MSTAQQRQDTTPIADPHSSDFWEQTWDNANQGSFLKTTQEQAPGAWDTFYDEVSDIYLEMWGQPWSLGQGVAELLRSHGALTEGCRVLDIGCGPGTHSVPLAMAGHRVLAVDNSAGMLAALGRRAQAEGLAESVEAVRSDWRSLQPGRNFRLVMAGFFPPALSPRGLARMERWSTGHCALVLGTGHEPHGFCTELWDEILAIPFHKGSYHLSCAVNWLIATGRQPNLRHLSWPSEFCMPLETVARFYRSYFAIFGKKGPEVSRRITAILERHAEGGMVRSSGQNQMAVLWWPAPQGA